MLSCCFFYSFPKYSSGCYARTLQTASGCSANSTRHSTDSTNRCTSRAPDEAPGSSTLTASREDRICMFVRILGSFVFFIVMVFFHDFAESYLGAFAASVL